MDSNLLFSLNDWSVLALVGCALVIIGVILESAEYIVKWGKKRKFRQSIENWVSPPARREFVVIVKILKPYLLFVETIGFVVLVIGLTIEIFGSFKSDQSQSKENAALYKDAVFSKSQVAILSNKTVRLSINLEEAKSNNLEMQSKVIEATESIIDLQRATLPPHLNVQTLLDSVIKQVPAIKVHLTIFPNTESEYEGDLFFAVCQKYGWNCMVFNPPTNDILFGVEINCNLNPKDKTDRAKDAALLLKKALNSMGFIAVVGNVSAEPPQTISVEFGIRPPPNIARAITLTEILMQTTNYAEKERLRLEIKNADGPIHRLNESESFQKQ